MGMKICSRCLTAIRSHGEIVYASPDYEDEWGVCEWCEEESDDLYEVQFGGVKDDR